MTNPPPPRVPQPPPPRPRSQTPFPAGVPAPPGASRTPVRIPVPPGWNPQPHAPVAPTSGAGIRPANAIPEGSKSYLVTLVLSYFFGMFGADRFYLGKTKSAFAKLFTFGGFGYWWIIDVFLTLFGRQRDAWGLRLEGYDRFKKTVWKVIGVVYGALFVIGMVAAVTTAAFDSAGPTTFGWILIAVLGVSIVAVALVLFLRHRPVRPIPAKVMNESGQVPPPIRAHLDKLHVLRQAYFQASATNPSAGMLAEQIDLLVDNTVELFQRLSSKASTSQRRRALAEYDENLGTFVAVLGHDYGLDLIANPRFWDDPDQRLASVHAALQAVDSQLLDNIKQVNARQKLIFDSGVDRLMDPRALGG